MPSCTALIVAAGSGERFGAALPKQYLPLLGVPLLRRSVEAFLFHPRVDAVQVVIGEPHRALYDEAMRGLTLPPPVIGGATRQESVRRGLEALAQSRPPDLVLVHDAARPLVSAATIAGVIEALAEAPGATAARPVVDTLRRAQNSVLGAIVDRDHLWQIQTPQGFHFDRLRAAHEAARGAALTDDTAVAAQAGMEVRVVLSNPENFKVTHTDDLQRAAQALAPGGEVRTGLGFDVHRLVPGDVIHLGGLAIPHTRTLEGHSDADVVLHAVVDALLGALGAGDIGQHFPPSDPQWKGKDSAHFVRHAVEMVRARGARITHVDVTLLCEQPRLGPHREAMRARLAELLGVTTDRASVKATTTERLGFTGREEGIAAQAVATLAFPLA